MFVVRPPGAFPSRKIRTLIDILVEHFGDVAQPHEAQQKQGTRLSGQNTQGDLSKAELEERLEMDHILRTKFGWASFSCLEPTASVPRASTIVKGVMAPSGTVVPGKTPGDTLLIVTSGSAEGESIHGNHRTRWRCSPGTVLVHPVHTHIEQIKWQGNGMHCVALVGLGNALAQLEMPRIGLIDTHAFDLALRLQYQAEHMMPLGVAYVEALNLTLTTYLRARYGQETLPRERDIGRLSSLHCEELRAYIDAHLHENISLEQLAALLGYSVNHLLRLFKEAFGIPPHRYIVERRVEQAKSLLLDRNYSVADVAFLCGFSNQAHMNLLFKRLTGMTPGVFRRGN
jgi:AraC family transcriptional regulator